KRKKPGPAAPPTGLAHSCKGPGRPASRRSAGCSPVAGRHSRTPEFPGAPGSNAQSGHGKPFPSLSLFSESGHGQVSAFPSPPAPALVAPPAREGPLGGGGDSARNGEERAGWETRPFPIQERVRPRVGHAHFRC